MTFKNILLDKSERLATVTISREKNMNALNREVLDELLEVFTELENDDEIRVICLAGAGDKAFVAGADIAAMKTMSPEQAEEFARAGGKLAATIEASSRPVIAAVNGYALGGGCELALACDFIYAGPSAQFGQPEVKLGVIPGFGGTQRLLRRVGVAKAKELILSGDIISGQEAYRIGLADRLVGPGTLMTEVRAMADRIAKNGPLAVAEAKRLIDVGQSMGLEQAITVECKSFARLFGTQDQTEGMAAFLEKRPAAFRGE